MILDIFFFCVIALLAGLCFIGWKRRRRPIKIWAWKHSSGRDFAKFLTEIPLGDIKLLGLRLAFEHKTGNNLAILLQGHQAPADLDLDIVYKRDDNIFILVEENVFERIPGVMQYLPNCAIP